MQLDVAMDMKIVSPNPARPIGRGPKVRAAVLTAALAEVAEVGYAALSVDNVARRAGVHKTTVYRHWKDRAGLITGALTQHVADEVPVPDTHAIDTDLREYARSVVRWLTSSPGQVVFAAIMSDAAHLPEIANVKRRFFEDRFRRLKPVITGAIDRGELPAGTDPSELHNALLAPIYLRLLVTAEPVDETTAEIAARVALAAARAGALKPA